MIKLRIKNVIRTFFLQINMVGNYLKTGRKWNQDTGMNDEILNKKRRILSIKRSFQYRFQNETDFISIHLSIQSRLIYYLKYTCSEQFSKVSKDHFGLSDAPVNLTQYSQR